LYPIDIYLYINNVSGISKGIYKYQPYSHSLYPLDIENVDSTHFFVGDNIDVINMNFCVFFEYSVNKNFVKYGELSLLNTLVELGGISHNFDLVCQSMDFTSCPIAGFNKSVIEKLLYLDGVNDHIVFTNICGKE
ncbi:SagB family peptide dehydrogenase, partial [Enterococcus faecium]